MHHACCTPLNAAERGRSRGPAFLVPLHRIAYLSFRCASCRNTPPKCLRRLAYHAFLRHAGMSPTGHAHWLRPRVI